MNVLITMGGLGARFKKAGYTVPKYKINVKGKTLFEWSMLSLSDFWNEKFIFIVRKEDNAKNFILTKCEQFNINAFVVEIEYLTSGQAETAMCAKNVWDNDDSLFVYNIDTYVEPGMIQKKDLHGDGFIHCFHANGDHWSFVKLNEYGYAEEIREKERISNNCSIGSYYFESASLFGDIYEEFYKDDTNLEKGEKYIAPMYNCMIKKGCKIYIGIIDREKVHVLGTPQEVEAFEHEKSTEC